MSHVLQGLYFAGESDVHIRRMNIPHHTHYEHNLIAMIEREDTFHVNPQCAAQIYLPNLLFKEIQIVLLRTQLDLNYKI